MVRLLGFLPSVYLNLRQSSYLYFVSPFVFFQMTTGCQLWQNELYTIDSVRAALIYLTFRLGLLSTSVRQACDEYCTVSCCGKSGSSLYWLQNSGISAALNAFFRYVKQNYVGATKYWIKQASMLHKNNEMKSQEYEMVQNEVNMNNSVKWSCFKVRVKVKHSNENLFSGTTVSNTIKEQWMTWGWIIAKWLWNEATKPGKWLMAPWHPY
jgi:hypothetical protein